MLTIIILIAKILGITLLVIAGLILLIVFTVLCVPIRYRGEGSFYEKPEGTVKVTWLFHLLSVKVSYREKPDLAVRLFGFRLFKDTGDAMEDLGKDAADFAEEPFLSAQELTEPLRDPKEEEPAAGQPSQAETETEPALHVEPEAEEPEPEFHTEPEAGSQAEPETGVQEKAEPALQAGPQAEPEAGVQEKAEPALQAEPEAGPQAEPQPEIKRGKKGVFRRIFEKIKHFLKSLAAAFKGLCVKMKQAGDFKEAVMTYVDDGENKKTFRLVLKQGKKVILHILPKKIEGTVTFGFDDPYRTGQVLTGAAFLYPVYHKQLSVQPVFDRQILEGELAFKGRVRLGTLLTAGLSVLMNKNFRTQLKRFINRRGA